MWTGNQIFARLEFLLCTYLAKNQRRKRDQTSQHNMPANQTRHILTIFARLFYLSFANMLETTTLGRHLTCLLNPMLTSYSPYSVAPQPNF